MTGSSARAPSGGKGGGSADGIPGNAVLILIDVQKGLDDPVWGPRNNPTAERNMARLLKAWRETKRPVIHVRHMSRRPGSPLAPGIPGNEIKDEVKPEGDEPVVEKDVNSAFMGTDLESRLRKNGFDTLVFGGLATDHCVSSTARMGGNLGFTCYVVADATATFDRVGYDGRRYGAEEVHGTALASLHGQFATVVSTDELLRRL